MVVSFRVVVVLICVGDVSRVRYETLKSRVYEVLLRCWLVVVWIPLHGHASLVNKSVDILKIIET